MSRLKKFTQSLLTGYLTLASQALYTFLSIPIALHYLSRAEFGLWGLTLEVSAYITLIDAGMSGSISRVLIDHKDDPDAGDYGSIIKTGALVGAVQGMLIILIGTIVSFSIAGMLRVPAELHREFAWLMFGQSLSLGLIFMTRIFMQILIAHQRYDIPNHAQSAVYILSLVGMWIGFALGFGVYSFLAVQILSVVLLTFVNLVAVFRLRLWPTAWGKITAARFKELFNYGGALFVYSMGMLLVNASQTILITRFIGLDFAGIWIAGTRVYRLIAQLLWRSQEYSGPPLAEMFVRGEIDRMRDRLRDMTYLTTNIALFGALGLALCNTTFVHLWTHGKMPWTTLNDLLLGIWLVVGTMMRAHVSLAGATKRFEYLCHVCFFEGFLFIALNILLRHVDGITRMLVLSILCATACSLIYSIRRTRRFFSLSWSAIGTWHRSTWRIAGWLTVIGIFTWFITKDWQPIARLTTNTMITGVFGGLVLLRYGFGKDLQNDIADKLPGPLRRMMLAVRAA